MRSQSAIAGALVAVLAAHGLRAQTPTDFSGRWRLDTAQSSAVGGAGGSGRGSGNSTGGGLGLGPSPTDITIAQTATTITIEQRGTPVAKIVYRLDGKESRGKMPAGPGTRDATFKTAWQDGRLVTAIDTVTPRGGRLSLQETRYLADADTLVVETQDPSRGNTRRVVYRRVVR